MLHASLRSFSFTRGQATSDRLADPVTNQDLPRVYTELHTVLAGHTIEPRNLDRARTTVVTDTSARASGGLPEGSVDVVQTSARVAEVGESY